MPTRFDAQLAFICCFRGKTSGFYTWRSLTYEMTASFAHTQEIPEGSDAPSKDQHELHTGSSKQHASTSARLTETGEDEVKYPSGIRLMAIGVGLMLAVVCSNLVSIYTGIKGAPCTRAQLTLTFPSFRIAQSWVLLLLKSLPSSIRFWTLVGTAQRTC